MKEKIIFINLNTERNDKTIYNFLVQNFYKVCIKENKKKLKYSGFCAIMCWELCFSYSDTQIIVNFIKKYGKWNSKCYFNCNNEETDNPNQFIYPMYDWDSRIKLLTAAIKNYRNK